MVKAIKLRYSVEAASCHPEFAQALPGFASKVGQTFAAPKIQEHLARIKNLRLEYDTASVEADEREFEDPKGAAERTRQFEFVKEPLTVPMLGTS